MSNVYIVVKDGCVEYVSSGNPRLTVRVLYLDDPANDFTEGTEEFDADLERAEKLPRVW